MAGDPNVYIGVGGKAKKTTDMYIGVNGVAKKVISGWIGDANGKARLFFGGDDVIKSIQRGSITFTAASTTKTITSVNTSKAFLMLTGATRTDSSIELTNATTITARSMDPSTRSTVYYQVIEYY